MSGRSNRSSSKFVTMVAVLAVLAPGLQSAASAAVPPRTSHNASRARLFRSPKVHRVAPRGATAASRGHRSADPKKVKELISRRSAQSATWVNDDGSLTVEKYLTPRFYEAGNSWKPIKTDLSEVAGKQDTWKSGANDWTVQLSRPSNPEGMVRIRQSDASVSFTPVQPSNDDLAPSVKGSVATYRNLWTGADLVQEIRSDLVKESIVLTNRDAAATYDFAMSGATPRAQKDGSISLFARGKQIGSIPAATVETSDKKPVKGRFDGSDPKVDVVDGAIRVSVSTDWLKSLPDSAFPVTIDPTYDPGSFHPTSVRAYSNGSPAGSTTTEVRLGTNSQGKWASAVSVPVPSAPAPLNGQPWQLGFASMLVYCGAVCNLTNATAFNPASTPTSYASVLSGPSVSTGFDASLAYGLFVFAGNTPSWVNGTSPWLGFTATSSTYLQISTSLIYFSYRYYELPPPPPINTPADQSIIATSTPTLTTAAPTSNMCASSSSTGTCDMPFNVYYDFKVRTAPRAESGQVVADSGWINGPYSTNGSGNYVLGTPSWKVPAGSLTDGVKYYVSVQVTNTLILYASDENSGNILITPNAGAESSFSVKLRLGDGGPSATDGVGEVPGESDSVSEGAPSPGEPSPSLTANLVTGDVSFSIASIQEQTVSGPAGVSFTYNSLQSATSGSAATGGASYGLRGQYFKDAGGHTFPSSAPVGSRVDPTIDLHGGFGASPIGGLDVSNGSAGNGYIVRWLGRLTLPSSGSVPSGTTFRVGGATTGGMRVIFNGSTVYDDWSGSAVATGKTGYSASSLSPGASAAVEVDYWEPNTSATTKMQFYVDQVMPSTGTHSEFLVPSNWMQTNSNGLPPGWSFGASDVSWTGLTDLGSQIVVNGQSGTTLTFDRNDDGTFDPPAGNDNSLTVSQGLLQLSTATGLVYVFNPDGSLKSASSAVDDTSPAKLQYSYTPVGTNPGDPVLLTSITDSVSGRHISLIYGGQAGCPIGNAAPGAMLCEVSGAAWDGSVTDLLYNSNQQLAGFSNPGSARSLFAYDSANRLVALRDVLANDYVSAGLPGSSGCSTTSSSVACQFDTVIAYDSSGRVSSISQPAPSDGSARPVRSYTYQPSTSDPGAGTTLVQVAGFSPAGVSGKIPAGYAYSESYDHQSRIIGKVQSTGLASHAVWDSQSRPIIQLGPDGQQASTVYDRNSNVTDTYGPAPAGCFAAGTSNPWPSGTGYATPPAPVQGYLPVADPEHTAGCLTKVPHAESQFDQGMNGLGVIVWPNASFAGAPGLHGTGEGVGSATATCLGHAGGTTDNDFCGTWYAGTAPGAADVNGKWSMRLAGTIDLPSSGQWQFALNGTQYVALWIDGVFWGDNSGFGELDVSRSVLAAGDHDIRVDVAGDKNAGTEYSISYRADTPSAPMAPIPLADLSPNYGLETRSVDPDGKVTATSYSNANGMQPQYRLVTSTTLGAGGSSPLTTSTSFEAPGSGYLRRTLSTRPNGDQTSYTYWGDAETLPNSICGVPAGTNQGGLEKSATGSAPTSSSDGRRQYFVYDTAGRVSGTWTGPQGTAFSSIPSAGWTCTARDSRGRTTSQTWPTHGAAPARTVTYTYSLYGNPLFSGVTDTASQNLGVSSAVDMLGRLVVYVDAFSQTTTIKYNQMGQTTEMSGPQGVIQNSYDPNTGVLKTRSVDGQWLAKPTYSSSTNNMTAVDYSNGSHATIGYDTNGRQVIQSYTKSSDNSLVTGDVETLSPAGRTISELQNINGSLQNANPAGATSTSYTYDDAGRLTSAYLPGSRADYSYAQADGSLGCEQPNAGLNSNRTKVTLTPTTGAPQVTSYCYNHADQLTRSVAGSGITLVGSSQAGQNLNGLQTNTPLTVTYPSGTSAGDQAILAVAVTKGTNITVPSGYTTIGTYQTNILLGNNVTFQVMRKTIASGESSVSVAFSKSDARTAIVAVYRGVDSTNPVDAFSGGTSGTASATAVTAPGVTTTAAGDRLVVFSGQKGNTAAVWTTPSGMTSLVSSTGGGSVTSAAADTTQSGVGPSGSETSTSSTSGALASVLVALKPGLTTSASTYDDRGNQLSDGTTTYTYDASDRLTTTTVAGVTTTYTYDPVGRMLSRTSGSTAVYYGYSGYTDSPANTRTGTGVVQQLIGLPGGATRTIQAAGAYHPVTAQRILNTATGVGAPTGAVANHASIALQVAGVGGVPTANVSAVAINLGSTGATAIGNLIAYPDGSTLPNISSLHFETGQASSNLAIVPVSSDGKIRIYNSSNGTTQIVGDIQGYYESGTADNEGALQPLSATRMMDTRDGTGGVPVAPVAANGSVSLQVAGVAGIPATTQISAVVLHVMATSPTAAGSVTVYPDGTSRPATSNVSFASGQSITNTVIVPVGSNGKVAFYNASAGTTHVVADVEGYYRSGPSDNNTGSYHPLPAARVLNTQDGTGVSAPGALGGSGSIALQIDGAGGVPASCVSAVAVNLTGSAATAGGDLVAYADGLTNPGTSNLRYQSTYTVSNLAIVPVGGNGKIRIANQSTTASVQVAGDVVGYYECGAGTSNDDLWSYADLHGNVTVTTDDSANRVGNIVNYDPWGAPLANPVSAANAAFTKNFSSFGGDGKVSDPSSGVTIMGARAYVPTEGRFLTVDPQEGGCANAYVYGFGDPGTQQDLSGRSSCAHKLLSATVSTVGLVLTITAVGLTVVGTGGAATIFIVGAAGSLVSMVGATLAEPSCHAGDKVACVSMGVSIFSSVVGIPVGLLGSALARAGIEGGLALGRGPTSLMLGTGTVGAALDTESAGKSTGDCLKSAGKKVLHVATFGLL